MTRFCCFERSNGGSGNETSAPLAPPPAILRDYIGPAPASILDLKARRGAADVLSPVDAKIDQMLEMELGPGLHGGSYSAGTVMSSHFFLHPFPTTNYSQLIPIFKV